MDPGGGGGGGTETGPGPGGGVDCEQMDGSSVSELILSSAESLSAMIVSSAPHPLQMVDSESSDSGFQDALEVQPDNEDTVADNRHRPTTEPDETPTSTSTTTTTTTTMVGASDNDVNVVDLSSAAAGYVTLAAEGDGSLLGMLFRRSTMRRSMRPFIPSLSPTPAPTSCVASSQTEPSTDPSNEILKVPLAPLSPAASDGRRSQRRNVQFAMEPTTMTSETAAAAMSAEAGDQADNVNVADAMAGVTVDTILVSIPEHETMLSGLSSSAASLPNSGPDPADATTTTTTTSSTATESSARFDGESEEDREVRVGGFWSHSSSSFLASLSCTVGMFDICRFSYLSFQYGGSFILQFLMLTVVFGIPMLSFQMAAGQYMGAGIMNMWKASPVFQGIGISAIFALALIGVYSVVPITWMFIYFRDSFVTTTTFRWGECRNFMSTADCLRSDLNSTEIFKRAIPAYFQNRVLKSQAAGNAIGSRQSPDLIFENVFNLAVIWIIVFICLSKGSKSYGRVIVAFSVCPLVCFYLVAIEILRRGSTGTEQIMSLNTDMNAFFMNGWSWLAAAREVFFIWGINGAVLMQIASHNKLKHNIKRDCAVIVLVTLSVILLSAFLTCSCIYIIYKTQRFSHRFIPSSYEMLEYSQFLVPVSQAAKMNSDLDKYMSTNYLLGVESTTPKMDTTHASGYQVARLATEIFPMALVQLGPHRISAFWPVLFYLALIAFGISQQLAVWRCVIEGFIAIRPKRLRRWETCITFFSCIFGFVFGLPFTAEGGAFVIHFMDVCVGCIWWLLLVYLAQLFALVLVRGRPYTSDDIVCVFADTPFMKLWLAPIMSFSWNVVLPVTLMVLSIASFKLGDFGRMFSFEDGVGYVYWPSWAKQFGALIQIVPILIIPLVSLVQASRYLGPNEQTFATRLDNFLRPVLPFAPRGEGAGGVARVTGTSGVATVTVTEPIPDDPPPKYTPPPSYNTATGLKILKRLNSLRMSFRRSQRGRASTSRNNSDVEMQRSAAMNTPTLNDTVVMTDVPPSYVNVVEAGVAINNMNNAATTGVVASTPTSAP